MTTSRRTASRVALVVAAVLALALSACSGSGSSRVEADGLIVDHAWARASAPSSSAGAAYVTIRNTTGRVEKLLSVSVPSSVARVAEMHETVSNGSSMMSMREVQSVTIPAGSTLSMEPGGYHVMVLDLAGPLVAGQEFTLNLGFMNAGVVSVPVKIRAS